MTPAERTSSSRTSRAAPPAEVVAPPAPPAVSPTQALRRVLEVHRPVLARLLVGTGIDEGTFVAWVGNAVRGTEDDPTGLLACEPETLLGAVMRCAQLGLAPNDGQSLAWVIPYRNRDSGRLEASFQLGYRGIMELARRAEPGLRFEGRAVYPNDEFEVEHGDDGTFRHVPYYSRKLPRGGDAYLWYVRVQYPNGDRHLHVVNRDDVERHRSYSKAPNSPFWTKSYDAAALRSAVVELRKFLPTSRQLSIAAGEGSAVDVRDLADELPLEPAPSTPPAAPSTPPVELDPGRPFTEED